MIELGVIACGVACIFSGLHTQAGNFTGNAATSLCSLAAIIVGEAVILLGLYLMLI